MGSRGQPFAENHACWKRKTWAWKLTPDQIQESALWIWRGRWGGEWLTESPGGTRKEKGAGGAGHWGSRHHTTQHVDSHFQAVFAAVCVIKPSFLMKPSVKFLPRSLMLLVQMDKKQRQPRQTARGWKKQFFFFTTTSFPAEKGLFLLFQNTASTTRYWHQPRKRCFFS